LKKTLESIPKNFEYQIVVHVDGSTDGSDKILTNYNYHVMHNKENAGIGRSIRNVVEYAKNNGYKAVALVPGNNKNNVAEVERLFYPIINEMVDFVQGSRYLKNSKRDHTPLFRLLMVKVHASFLSIITKRRITDALEGFRAFKLSILENSAIDLNQDWLNTYGLETYLYYSVTKNHKYKYLEVPVSKIYPENKKNILNKNGESYSHIRPFLDWWHILKPIIYLTLGIKK
jgi:dolichol-phosphate mannosyltransferase